MTNKQKSLSVKKEKNKAKKKPVVLDLPTQDLKLATKTPGMIVPNKDRLKVELSWIWLSSWWNRSPKGLILGILIIGLLYRILLTWGGNFIFHIDSARDMLDVREMVVLHHPRLIGPTSGIDGLFTGPGWYYFLAIPFILTGGDPYAEVLFMDLFWVIGGIFLLTMLKKWGTLAVITGGSLWIASNYIVLVTLYSFNPNPVTLLSPFLIFVLARYLDLGTMKSALILGFLCAVLWNFEMAFAVFLPFIIILAVIFRGKWRYLYSKNFWVGIVLPFFSGLLPQIFFELRHNFFMTRSVMTYLTEQKSLHSTFSLSDRVLKSWNTLQEGFRGTFYNDPFLIYLGLALFIILSVILVVKRNERSNSQVISAILVAIFPFVGFGLFPIVIQLWHIEVSLAALIFLVAIAVGSLMKINNLTKWLAIGITVIFVGYSAYHLEIVKNLDINRPIDDPSEFKNEIAAIDYAYQTANGLNFKSYVYSPGILDLPYEYNFWWYGQNTKYGYLPEDYGYLPNMPEYIKSKEQYRNGKNPSDSGLVILIKEPGFPQREDLWKNSFTSIPTIKTDTIGPLRIEVKQSTPSGKQSFAFNMRERL